MPEAVHHFQASEAPEESESSSSSTPVRTEPKTFSVLMVALRRRALHDRHIRGFDGIVLTEPF